MFHLGLGQAASDRTLSRSSSALVSTGYAGFLVTDVDWQATGSRSELWDRRQVCSKNRMGAQALGRAREELRPRGLSCLCRNGLDVSTKSTLCLRTLQPGYTGRSAPIMRSQQHFQGL